MNYHLKNKPLWISRKKAILISSLFFLLFLLSFLFPNGMRSLSFFISRPVWAVSDTVVNSFSNLTQYFVFKSNLISENQALRDENETLKLKQVDYGILSTENDDLKSQLGRTNNKTRFISRVLSKPPRSPYDTLVIDAGTAEGVVMDDAVYLSGNVIVGTISSVTTHTSVVQLFSTANNKQEVVLERTGASFEIIGQGGANFKLEVPKETDIIWGDVFTYPGISSAVVGSVYYIAVNPQSSFKTIYIRIPGNIFQSKYVFVENTN